MENKNNQTSVELIEKLNIKIEELKNGQKDLEKVILENMEHKNKLLMKRINKIVEYYEILEMQNETIAREIRGGDSKK